MATYYADFDLGTGSNDGTSWANAWQTMAAAIAGTNGTPPAAGDTVYCRGTDTLSSGCTITQAGDETTGMIKWIGVDGSGNNVGGTTRAILDGNGNSIDVLTLTGGYNHFENFAFCNSANGDGVTGAGDYCVFINCAAYSNGAFGFDTQGITGGLVIGCLAYSNTNTGFAVSNSHHIFCCSRDNTQDGFGNTSTQNIIFGCLAYDNADDGIGQCYRGCLVMNCVADQNGGTGIEARSAVSSYLTFYIANRITNGCGDAADIGLNLNGELTYYGWNYIYNNGDNIANTTLATAILQAGVDTNTINTEGAGSPALDGYTSITDGSEDYNLSSTADLRRTAVTIPTS